MTSRLPDAEVVIDEALVRALLAAERADLAVLPLRRAGAGWDNETWRLGDALAVRLPRRELAVGGTQSEQRWLGRLAPTMPVPIPVPLHLGRPAAGYPWPWSVVPWFDGTTAEQGPVGPVAARRLGDLMRALHVPSDPEAPYNPFRSVALAERPSPLPGLERLYDGTPPAALLRGWDRALRAPVPDRRWWVHGDLHARNLVMDSGELRAVIDWGDLCGGDPAVDLSALWTVLGPGEHGPFCAAYGPVDGDLHLRARGWALVFGVTFAELHEDPDMVRIGRRTLEQLCG